jgi:predicted Zn finger-like uncharacterized protein
MKTQCPNCKARFNVDDKFAGKQAKCPKCVKPFTIVPFVEMPVEPAVAAAAPVKNADPVPVEIPVKKPEPIAPSVKIAEPVKPPVKSPLPVAPPVKKPEPVSPPAKIAEPAKTPVKIAEQIKQEKPEPKPPTKKTLSKIVFVYCWMAVRIIAGILGASGFAMAIRKGAYSTLIAAFAAADVFLVCSVLIELMLFYKMWTAIKDKQVSISPAKAAGFLFIPVFNIYWALLMLTGFAEDYNAFIQRHTVKAKELSITIFLIYAFMFILTAFVVTIPMICVFGFIGLISRAFIGYPHAVWALLVFVLAAGIAHFITYILVAMKTCNAINALPERKSG